MAISPPLSVPVTTVPEPGNGKYAVDRQQGTLPLAAPEPEASTASNDSRSAGRPMPVRAETAMIGAAANVVVETSSRTSSRTRSSQSASATSALVRTITAVHTKQIEDCQVLDSLGHGALVGGDHEQRRVNAADAGEHVLDEPLVTGDVDDADALAAR